MQKNELKMVELKDAISAAVAAGGTLTEGTITHSEEIDVEIYYLRG